LDPQELVDKLLAREEESTTVLRKGLAIPHIVVEGKNIFQLVFIRARTGVIFPNDELTHIIFILIGSLDERNLHLKTIAAIAQITQTSDFDKQWMAASNKENLRNILLLSERRRA